MKAQVGTFFNPGKGLHRNIKGAVSDRVIQDLPSFLKAAGRDYAIDRVPAFDYCPEGAIDEAGNFVPGYVELDNQFNLRRSSDCKVISPKTVTKSYGALSLMDISEELQPWCSAGWATPDSVYSRLDGSLEVLTLRIDAGGALPDNEYKHYVQFFNPHATGGKAYGKVLTLKLVCVNGMTSLVSSNVDFIITHRIANGNSEAQRKIMADRAKEAVAAAKYIQEKIAELAEKLNTWQGVKLTVTDATKLTDTLLGIEDIEKTSQRTINRRDAILQAFSMPQFGTFGQNAEDWINAITFVNSSPLAEINKKSKTDDIDRAIRNGEIRGSGFLFEQKAESVLAAFIG